MRAIDKLQLRLRSLFGRRRVEDDLDEELRFHLEHQIEQNVAAGMKPAEARRQALREFGGVEQMKEQCRDTRGVRFLETLVQDLRYAVRLLARRPGFTVVAVLTLALGVGATSAVFSVINAVMLRPLPYPDADRLVVVWEVERQPLNSLWEPVADRIQRDRSMTIDRLAERWRALSQSFDQMTWYTSTMLNWTGNGEPERIEASAVSADYFQCLGIAPALGRGFLESEMTPGKDRVVILGNLLWRRRFAADPDTIGKTMHLDGEPHTIVGVMPEGFRALGPNSDQSDLWVPITRDYQPNHSFAVVNVIGRLKPDVTIAQAQAEMDSIAKGLESEGRLFQDKGVNLQPLAGELVRQARSTLLILLGAAGCILLIACANLAGLMLARGRARQKEVGIRTVLGVSRWRLIRQFLTESAVLAIVGGVLGLALSVWIARTIALMHPGSIARLDEVHLDLAVFAFCSAVAGATALIAGLLPAVDAARLSPNEVIKDTATHASRGRRLLLPRRLLVAGEVCLALVLLIGTGLLLRSLASLRAVDLGFNPQRLLTMTVPLPAQAYGTPQQQTAFAARLLERVKAHPSVEAAAVSNSVPMASSFNMSMAGVEIEGRQLEEADAGVNLRAISAGYFETMGIPLLRGRDFTEADEAGNDSIIINEATARDFWQENDPIGHRMVLNKPYTVIGIVADVKNNGLARATSREIYAPFAHFPTTWIGLAVRTSGDPISIAGDIQAIVRDLDPDQPVEKIATMSEVLDEQVGPQRFYLALLGSFAALGLLLAVVGIYGVVAYSVSQRTREIGLRMALGAESRNVLAMVLREGAVLGGIGVALGVAGSLAATRALESYLFGVKPNDAVTFAVVSALLLTVCLAASYVPARRAARVDPMTALRHE